MGLFDKNAKPIPGAKKVNPNAQIGIGRAREVIRYKADKTVGVSRYSTNLIDKQAYLRELTNRYGANLSLKEVGAEQKRLKTLEGTLRYKRDYIGSDQARDRAQLIEEIKKDLEK